MISKIVRFLSFFLPFTLTLFVIQYYISNHFLKEIPFYNSVLSIYIFHLVAVLLSYFFLLVINKYFFSYTGFAFLGFGILKMVFSLVFLMPLIKSNVEDKIPDVLAFFIPFFLFLFYETIQSIKLLNQNELQEKQ